MELSPRTAPVEPGTVAPRRRRSSWAYGVLVLTLRPDGWDWSFLETDGTEGDAGTASCH